MDVREKIPCSRRKNRWSEEVYGTVCEGIVLLQHERILINDPSVIIIILRN